MALSSQQLEIVQSTAIFRSLPEAVVGEFAGGCRLRTLPAGGTIFGPSERADRFFLVLAGRVKVYKLSSQGKEQILHYYGPGKTFGEAAMWMGKKFPAFAEAVEATTLLVIARSRIVEAVRKDPELAVGMIAGLSRKLHEFERLIAELSLKDVLGRLAGVLLTESRQAGSATFRLDQTKRQLASRIGTVAESLSRAFKKLEDAEMITLRGSQVTIRKEAALAALAETE